MAITAGVAEAATAATLALTGQAGTLTGSGTTNIAGNTASLALTSQGGTLAAAGEAQGAASTPASTPSTR